MPVACSSRCVSMPVELPASSQRTIEPIGTPSASTTSAVSPASTGQTAGPSGARATGRGAPPPSRAYRERPRRPRSASSRARQSSTSTPASMVAAELLNEDWNWS